MLGVDSTVRSQSGCFNSQLAAATKENIGILQEFLKGVESGDGRNLHLGFKKGFELLLSVRLWARAPAVLLTTWPPLTSPSPPPLPGAWKLLRHG